jgi:heptosyltransferase-2
VSPTAVLQAKPGIGDVIWHLPFIRAIAAASPGGKVTFLAPPSSGAKDLLVAEPAVVETIYFDQAGSEFRRALNLIRLVPLLRRRRFRTIWILDRTIRPALAAVCAGIPERIGLGLTAQRLFITNAGIDRSHYHEHPVDWLCALMAAMQVPLRSTEPELRIAAETLAAIDEKFSTCPRPWIVLGIGASHAERDWPDDYWLEFLAGVRRLTSGTVFVIGGGHNMLRAQSLIGRSAGARAENACDLRLADVPALLHGADLFVGTDSGPMNIAAAVATPTFALFGINRVLTYSKYIHPITPAGGPAPGGMLRISPGEVLQRVGPYLTVGKDNA